MPADDMPFKAATYWHAAFHVHLVAGLQIFESRLVKSLRHHGYRKAVFGKILHRQAAAVDGDRVADFYPGQLFRDCFNR